MVAVLVSNNEDGSCDPRIWRSAEISWRPVPGPGGQGLLGTIS